MKSSALSEFVEYVRSQVPASPSEAEDQPSPGYADQTDGQTQPQPDAWEPQAPSLVTIVVSPQGLIVDGKGWQQFKATGWFSDGSQQDLTDSARWFTGDPSLARIGGPGRVFFTGKPGSVMINVSHKQTPQICGTAVLVHSTSPPQPQPPGQPDNAGPDYAQGDSDVSDAASSVEGSIEGGTGSSVSGSTDDVSASVRSGGDLSGDASGTDGDQVADAASASRQVDDFEWPPKPRPHVHKPAHDPNPDMTGKPTKEPGGVIRSEGTTDLSSATATLEGTAPECASSSGSAGTLSAEAGTGGDSGDSGGPFASASSGGDVSGTTSGTDAAGGLSASATGTSD